MLRRGPPCQDFSTLWNHDGARTARGNLFREIARFLAALEPAGFVVENVPGLLSANRGAAWTIVRHALRAPASFLYGRAGARYDVTAQVVDMADLGVPQHRERLMVVGVRRDVGERPPLIPAPAAERHRSVRDALDEHPLPEDAPNHERGLDSQEVVERLGMIPPGKDYEVIPDPLQGCSTQFFQSYQGGGSSTLHCLDTPAVGVRINIAPVRFHPTR